MTSNLVWIKLENTEHYLQFWKDNVNEIYQQKRKDVPDYLKWLADEKVIEITKEAEEQLKEKFYDTASSNQPATTKFPVTSFRCWAGVHLEPRRSRRRT
jgi:CRISPR/Cas system-associated endonuclease Cas1